MGVGFDPLIGYQLQEGIHTAFLDMNHLLSLKLLLIKHGKCSTCKDKPSIRHCGECFNTRLEPEVLEAITVLDLADRFKESEKRMFEERFQDDYTSPPEGSYFHHVIERKQRLEQLYSEFMSTGADAGQEKEIFTKLVGGLLDGKQVDKFS